MGARLVAELSKPDAYPEAPSTVVLLQTHISFVFIADEFVYKIKKPVDFGFLDFSTLEKRRYYCEQELKLNRRLSPAAYLGVVPVTDDSDKLVFGGKGEVVEYAVKMRKIPTDKLMKTLLLENRLQDDMVESVARKIAVFHESAERSAEIDKFGTLAVIKTNTDENFEQTTQYIGRALTKARFELIKSYTTRFYESRSAVLDKRISGKRIRDCHGDLHMEHICITEPITVFDCIEFNERFRYSDTAADIAFLAMDLDYHGAQRLSKILIEAYVRHSGDEAVYDVLDFYKVYRAYVRGKVLSFRLDDPRISEGDKADALSQAGRYFELAAGYVSI